MSDHLRSFWPRKNWDSLLAALAGILIIHYFCRHSGIGVSPDSVDYLSTASNIRQHGSAVNYSGRPLVNFPLGYPMLLTAIEWITGSDALTFGPVLNEALFGLLILLCGVMMERSRLHSKWYKLGLLSVVVLSPCLLEIYSMLWSETLFLVLLLLFILSFHRYLGSGGAGAGLRRLWAPALIAALACVTRYAGVTLIATGGLLILFGRGVEMRGVEKPGMRRRLSHAALFGCVSSSLLAINLVRNALVTGTLTGHREAGMISLGNAFRDYCLVLLGWLRIDREPENGGGYFVVGLLLVAFLAVVFIRRWRRESPASVGRTAIGYFSVYSVFIILSATLSRFQTLDSRLLSPLFLPILLGVAGECSSRPGARRFEVRGVVFVFLLSALQWGQIKTYRENWEGIRDAGIPGYTEDDWAHSPTMDYVRQQFGGRAGTSGPAAARDSLPIYSNADDAIWFLTRLHAHTLPHKESAGELGNLMGRDRFYVVWFNDGYNSDLINIEKISQTKLMVWTKAFADGAVYYFTSR